MGGRLGIKRCIFLLLALLLLYLSLYTWNLRTGVIDSLAANTGLEAVALVLKPGKWTARQISGFWDRYIYFVGLRRENEGMRSRLATLQLENAELRELARKAALLERLMEFSPPTGWERQGTRVVAHRLGPFGALETMLVDKGSFSQVEADTPAITPDGVVGRVLKASPTSSVVLLLTDPNSRIAVRGQKSRTTGILVGQGAGERLGVLYVPLNAPLEEDEVLITSGLAGLYPPGFPVARVERIERNAISLFQTVQAVPVVAVREVENLLLLRHLPHADDELLATNATASKETADNETAGAVQ